MPARCARFVDAFGHVQQTFPPPTVATARERQASHALVRHQTASGLHRLAANLIGLFLFFWGPTPPECSQWCFGGRGSTASAKGSRSHLEGEIGMAMSSDEVSARYRMPSCVDRSDTPWGPPFLVPRGGIGWRVARESSARESGNLSVVWQRRSAPAYWTLPRRRIASVRRYYSGFEQKGLDWTVQSEAGPRRCFHEVPGNRLRPPPAGSRRSSARARLWASEHPCVALIDSIPYPPHGVVPLILVNPCGIKRSSAAKPLPAC